MRTLISLLALGLLSLGCDDRSAPPVEPEAQTTSTDQPQPTSAPAATLDSPTKPLSLEIIPFIAEAPESWGVLRGLAGRMVLHGNLASGEIEVLLSNPPSLKPEAFNNLVQDLKNKTTQRSGETTRLVERDNMTILETVTRFDEPGKSPAETLVVYNVRYLVPDSSLDYRVYELSIGDLSLEMFEKDGELIRKVLMGLKYDPKGTDPTP